MNIHNILKIFMMVSSAIVLFSVRGSAAHDEGTEVQQQAPQLSQQQGNITQTTTTLSEARAFIASTSLNELVFFGGGDNGSGAGPTNQVDICNATSGSWTTATLSLPRRRLAATSLKNVVLFGGGWNGVSTYYNNVDIYNVSDGSWSTATLSQARGLLAAASVEDVALFGGGVNGTSYVFNVVDIYNVTNNVWTSTSLSEARYYLAATSVANRWALFGGGTIDGTNASDVVDMFDSLNGIWSVWRLNQSRYGLTATAIGNLALFGGGTVDGNQPSNVVDIFNLTSPQTWSIATLSVARYYFAASSIGDIVAFGGGTPDNNANFSAAVDMYNVTSNIWFTAILSQPRDYIASSSSINKIFFGGGYNGSRLNVVDIFEIPLPLSPPSSSSQIPSLPLPSNPTTNNLTILSNVPSITTLPISVSATVSNPKGSNVGINVLPLAAIVGIVIGIVALLIGIGVVLFLILFIKRRKPKKKYKQEQIAKNSIHSEKRETMVIENVVDTIHNYDGTNTISTTSSATTTTTYQPGTETLQGLSPGQILLNELEIGQEIGEGTYGRVCVGKWKKYRVALKFCQNRGKMEEFLREANLMISLPPYPNVVRMYGVSIDGTQPIIVMEYCAGGSLDKLLYDKQERISNERKIGWVHEIAEGMRHLHKYNIVHRDLAARNILLSQPYPSDAHLKISDFGMSRMLQQDIEGKTMNKVGPIRWMAPESVGQQVYSKKSDVWMFGILVYEIVAQREPHTMINPSEIPILIRDKGFTPTVPNGCPEKLRQLMEMCWNRQPQQRPSFEVICGLLE
jgi:hypothetical protein